MNQKTSMQITRLRKAIDRETKKMLLALSRRTNAARKIGEIKAKAGISVRDSAREKLVLEGAGDFAEKIGLPETAGRELALFCIKQAHVEEERVAIGKNAEKRLQTNVIKSKKTRR